MKYIIAEYILYIQLMVSMKPSRSLFILRSVITSREVDLVVTGKIF